MPENEPSPPWKGETGEAPSPDRARSGPPGAGPAPDPGSADVTIDANPRIAARLFILPAVIGGLFVLVLGLYFLFSALTRETQSADAYLEDVRIAAGNRRWQAAYELSRLLESGEAKVREDTAVKTLEAFRGSAGRGEDPRVRRYLALALGRLRDPRAVPDLVKALSDADPDTRIYSALALGGIGDRAATAPLTRALSDADPGVRKSAAYALGGLADPASADALRESLHDQEVDVTWNAAVALARMGDPTGAEVLRSMADREFVERATRSEEPATVSTALVTAVQGLVMIEDLAAIPQIRRLTADPDLRVREAAIEGLKKLETGSHSEP